VVGAAVRDGEAEALPVERPAVVSGEAHPLDRPVLDAEFVVDAVDLLRETVADALAVGYLSARRESRRLRRK
jgi:hypothetical protein